MSGFADRCVITPPRRRNARYRSNQLNDSCIVEVVVQGLMKVQPAFPDSGTGPTSAFRTELSATKLFRTDTVIGHAASPVRRPRLVTPITDASCPLVYRSAVLHKACLWWGFGKNGDVR